MSKFELDLTLDDGVDEWLIADMLLTILFNMPDDAMPGVFSIDGCDPINPKTPGPTLTGGEF